MAITQVISNFPDAPNSSTDTPQEFNTKADAFVNHQSGIYTPEVNTWATEANVLADEISAIVATLPDGTIDDTTASGINTYSSNKIEAIVDAVPFTEINDSGSSLTEVYSSQKIEDLSTTNVKIAGSSMTGTLNTPEVNIGGNIVDAVNYGIESGSDANGEYIKFPDGTLICSGRGAITPVPDVPTSVPVTFPYSFIDLPIITLGINSTVSGTTVLGYSWAVRTTTGCLLYVTRTNTTATEVYYQAIGRWK